MKCSRYLCRYKISQSFCPDIRIQVNNRNSGILVLAGVPKHRKIPGFSLDERKIDFVFFLFKHFSKLTLVRHGLTF
jgi:hypothetical protein